MTKAEELKLVDRIEGLIAESGAHSYISMTFAGICDVCRHNIEDDFGVVPVHDMGIFQNSLENEARAHDTTKKQLAEAQKMCKEALDYNAELQTQIAELREQRDAMADCVDGNIVIIDRAEAEIRKLKAEIVRMKLERMTDVEYADLYEKLNVEG